MGMILQEAFRYQSYLDNLINEARAYVCNTSNVMVITETHEKSKENPAIEDEIKDNLSDRMLNVDPQVVVEFMLAAFEEREKLFDKINQAKIESCPKMDMTISLNNTRRGIISALKQMVALKQREKKTRGSAYCFNAEGNQTQYYYNITIKSVPEFDRNEIKNVINKLSNTSDADSNQISYWMSTTVVDYEPIWSINDTFEDVIENFK